MEAAAPLKNTADPMLSKQVDYIKVNGVPGE